MTPPFLATDFTGVALIITSVGSLIAVVFTGYISVRQLPQVHKLVNATATRSQHFKCLGWLHSEKCLWPEDDDVA